MIIKNLRTPTLFATLAWAGGVACATPVEQPWPVDGPDDTVAIAAAACSGWYAAADSFEDSVEIRDIRGELRRVVTRAEIAALLPWMNLAGGPDGPSAVAWTASGRVLYVLVHDASAAGDGQGSDAVLRYDVPSDSVSVYARLDAFDRDDAWPHLSMVHHRGRLYVGTVGAGVRIYAAAANSATGSLLTTLVIPGGGASTAVRGLTVDRDTNNLYYASDAGVWRTSLGVFPPGAGTQIVNASGAGDLRAIAWGDTFGAASMRGLYLLRSGSGDIAWLTAAQASGGSVQTPEIYLIPTVELHDLAFAPDGRLLAGADEDAVAIRDSADTRLSFDSWLGDEFSQHVTFARGLISPDGEPAGWVIDGDVTPSGSRFHPATPDGAGWTLLMLVMNHELTGDPTAQAQARTVLTRYAGLASDNIRPLRSADGIYKHWIDPFTGTTKSMWPDEFATLSTMKIVMGAARAMQHWPDDPVIVRAASRIIFRVSNWSSYVTPTSMAFKGLNAGADPGSFAGGFHEGIIFVEQAGAYGGAFAAAARDSWFTRSNWSTATFLTGRPISSTGPGRFEAAFISLYSALVSQPYRQGADWQAQVNNLRWSNGAWTDDNGPRHFTVFSAGTTVAGYNADSLSPTNHPDNIATFPSLLAMAAFGENADAVAGYAAYRKGARQNFKTGASLLYRRADTNPAWLPNSAGLPDVSLGGLGLAEIIEPGVLDRVLATPYPPIEQCPVDVNGDGTIDIDDLYARVASPSDLNGDNASNVLDVLCLRAWLRRNEARRE